MKPEVAMSRMWDGEDEFEVTTIQAERPTCVGLFAAGRGGNPLRHISLLRSLAGTRCTVIAPHFELLPLSPPTGLDLNGRILRLRAAARTSPSDLPIVGIGHSIGTVALLVLAGAKAHTRAGDQVTSECEWKFARLALLAPPTDFFRRPGALADVATPVRIWAGANDSITPPDQPRFLHEALVSQSPVELSIDKDAGHFTFMDEPPPNAPEPHPDRRAFLASLADELGRFVAA